MMGRVEPKQFGILDFLYLDWRFDVIFNWPPWETGPQPSQLPGSCRSPHREGGPEAGLLQEESQATAGDPRLPLWVTYSLVNSKHVFNVVLAFTVHTFRGFTGWFWPSLS